LVMPLARQAGRGRVKDVSDANAGSIGPVEDRRGREAGLLVYPV
jgi:hypothetical protein